MAKTICNEGAPKPAPKRSPDGPPRRILGARIEITQDGSGVALGPLLQIIWLIAWPKLSPRASFPLKGRARLRASIRLAGQSSRFARALHRVVCPTVRKAICFFTDVSSCFLTPTFPAMHDFNKYKIPPYHPLRRITFHILQIPLPGINDPSIELHMLVRQSAQAILELSSLYPLEVTNLPNHLSIESLSR